LCAEDRELLKLVLREAADGPTGQVILGWPKPMSTWSG